MQGTNRVDRIQSSFVSTTAQIGHFLKVHIMATKKAPAPAAKAAPAPAPAAKKAAPAAKKAAAPAPVEEVAAEEVAVDVGTKIVFKGYDDTVPQEEQHLTAGETYEVAGFTEPEGDDPGGDPYVMVPNPAFNKKQKESDANPKAMAVAVFEHEYDVAAEEEEAAAEEAAPVAAPAAKSVGKGRTKAAAAPVAEEPAAEEATDEEELPELEGEDEEVLALVNGERDLIEVAQELETTAAQSEYRLGGVLFHIKKAKSYLELEGGEAYAEKGGFTAFLKDYFNIEYRKAQYLIDIYVAFTTMQIEDPAAKVAAMGWAKASKIARPMMLEGANVEDLVSLAENNTLKDLSTAIKEQVEVGGTRTPGTKVTRVTFKLRLAEQEAATAQGILDAVKGAQSMKDDAEAFMFILNDWAATNAPASAAAVAPKQTSVGKPAAKKAAAAAPAAKPAAKKAAAKA